MDVIPAVKTCRFNELAAGELFIYCDNHPPVLALKTLSLPDSDGDPPGMVLLGPAFDGELREAFLMPWVQATVLSLGKDFAITLPLDARAWSTVGPSRDPVCLAVAEGETYICANAGESSSKHIRCFVNVKTGAVMMQRVPRLAMYTNTWQIDLAIQGQRSRCVIKYPVEVESEEGAVER